jgi:hypothetical protein
VYADQPAEAIILAIFSEIFSEREQARTRGGGVPLNNWSAFGQWENIAKTVPSFVPTTKLDRV